MEIPDLTSVFNQIIASITGLLPAALGAIVLVLAGWIFASILRFVTRKILTAIVTQLDRQSGLTAGLGGTRLREDAPRVIGAFVYWVVLLFFLAAAIDKLPLPIVTGLLQSMAYYLPKVLLAVVVAFVGLGAGSLANQWITQAASAAGVGYAPALGRVAQVAVFVVALIVGAQQIGLESGFFTATISIVMAATLGGMALAFGLGSGPIVSNIMASYYAAKAYRIGDIVRVAGYEGTVREISPTSIVLDSADGEVHLPARKYCDEVSVVLRGAK